MKVYRNLNGCVSRMHRVIYEAYDKGYAQGRKDFKRSSGNWFPAKGKHDYMTFLCSSCNEPSIAPYSYCPWCGSENKGEIHD